MAPGWNPRKQAATAALHPRRNGPFRQGRQCICPERSCRFFVLLFYRSDPACPHLHTCPTCSISCQPFIHPTRNADQFSFRGIGLPCAANAVRSSNTPQPARGSHCAAQRPGDLSPAYQRARKSAAAKQPPTLPFTYAPALMGLEKTKHIPIFLSTPQSSAETI